MSHLLVAKCTLQTNHQMDFLLDLIEKRVERVGRVIEASLAAHCGRNLVHYLSNLFVVEQVRIVASLDKHAQVFKYSMRMKLAFDVDNATRAFDARDQAALFEHRFQVVLAFRLVVGDSRFEVLF